MFTELLKENNMNSYLDYFNKDKKKFRNQQLLYGSLFFIIFTLVILMTGKQLLLIFTPVGFLLGYKIPYINLIFQKKEADLTVSFLFPQFLQSFIALSSSSGNVYQMLKNSIPYTGEPLRSELVKLLRKIEVGNNRREDYLAFAEFVGTSEAYMIMNMIYQFSEFGIKKETLTVLEDYIKNMTENKTNELINKKMASMDKLGLMPLFVSLFFVISFAGVIFWHYFQHVIGTVSDVF